MTGRWSRYSTMHCVRAACNPRLGSALRSEKTATCKCLLLPTTLPPRYLGLGRYLR